MLFSLAVMSTYTGAKTVVRTVYGNSNDFAFSALPSVLWLGSRKGIRPVKNWVVWDEMQTSRCHCHSLSLAPVNPDWF